MTFGVAVNPHRERLSRAAKAADKRRVLSEVRSTSLRAARRTASGEGTAQPPLTRVPASTGTFFWASKRTMPRPKGGKSSGAIGTALAKDGFRVSASLRAE